MRSSRNRKESMCSTHAPGSVFVSFLIGRHPDVPVDFPGNLHAVRDGAGKWETGSRASAGRAVMRRLANRIRTRNRTAPLRTPTHALVSTRAQYRVAFVSGCASAGVGVKWNSVSQWSPVVATTGDGRQRPARGVCCSTLMDRVSPALLCRTAGPANTTRIRIAVASANTPTRAHASCAHISRPPPSPIRPDVFCGD